MLGYIKSILCKNDTEVEVFGFSWMMRQLRARKWRSGDPVVRN